MAMWAWGPPHGSDTHVGTETSGMVTCPAHTHQVGFFFFWVDGRRQRGVRATRENIAKPFSPGNGKLAAAILYFFLENLRFLDPVQGGKQFSEE